MLMWPECSKNCELIEVLGASECENVCPHRHAPDTKKDGRK